jgi:hypothetical protein
MHLPSFRVRAGIIGIVIVAMLVWMMQRRSPSPAPSAAIRVVDVATPAVLPVPVTPAPEAETPVPTADPLADAVAAAPPVVQERHRLLKTQAHNDATIRASQRLVSAMPAGLGVVARGAPPRVDCSTEMCELIAEVVDAPDVVGRDLANPLWRDTLPRLGYTPGPSAVVTRDGKTVFLMYIDRMK